MTDEVRHCGHPGPWPHRARAIVPPLGEIDIDLCDACQTLIAGEALRHISVEGTDPGLPVFMDAPESYDGPPADHGSDRYGYIELVAAPDGVEPPARRVERLLADACQDCNPNLFVYYLGPTGRTFSTAPGVDPSSAVAIDGHVWWPVTAHDDGCPTCARTGGLYKHDPRQAP